MNKVRIFNFQYILPFSADTVWKLVAENYGDVADYSNGLISSSYLKGATKGIEGCERRCDIDNKGTYLIEKMVNLNSHKMQFTNLITQANKLPIVPLLSKTVFTLSASTNDSCKMTIEVHFRTKPAFLALFMKGVSSKQMANLAIGIEHFLKTREKVTKQNFATISKKYTLVAS